MRPYKNTNTSSRRPPILHLVSIAAVFSLLVFAIQSSLFTGDRSSDLYKEEIRLLSEFQSSVQQCVANRGLGLTAQIVGHCKLTLKFPEGANSTWYNEQFKIFEPLEYHYDICDAILLWEQYRNMTTVLTREYLDAQPDGWLQYAAKRIAQLYGFSFTFPRDFIKYAEHVGLKRNFRLVVRGAARNMVKILNGSSAKGTGMKSIELALSMCDIVDIYGFTVDPGYTEWTRYFSTPRKGHNPLQGRAYYQLLECLGVIRIHSPMRAERRDWSDIPSRGMISRAHAAAWRLKRCNGPGQFGSCKVWGSVNPDSSGPISGFSDMSDVRKYSNYNKWEVMPFESLRKEARDHYKQLEGVSLYKVDGNKLDDLVCVKHSSRSEV